MATATLTGSDAWLAYREGRVPALVERDVVDVVGPDALKFLHALLSQDVATMEDGETRWSFLLQPQGKLVSHLRVHRRNAEHYVLDTDPAAGEALHAALRRYLIRTNCTLDLREAVPVLRFHGDAPGDGRKVPAHPLLGAVDVFDAPAPDTVAASEVAETDRVLAGVPHHGSELDETTIPNATGLLGVAVSFTKGCYVGQELVERIDARTGAAPTRLARLRIEAPDGDLPTLPVRLGDATRSLGLLTSCAVDPATGERVGLGYVARSVERGERLHGAGADAAAEVVVEVLDDVDGRGR